MSGSVVETCQPRTQSSSHFLNLSPILPTHSFPLSPAANAPAWGGFTHISIPAWAPTHLDTTALLPKDISD